MWLETVTPKIDKNLFDELFFAIHRYGCILAARFNRKCRALGLGLKSTRFLFPQYVIISFDELKMQSFSSVGSLHGGRADDNEEKRNYE